MTMNRTSEIVITKTDLGEELYSVLMYEDGKLVEHRTLPGKNIYYAGDLMENWETGIIKTVKTV